MKVTEALQKIAREYGWNPFTLATIATVESSGNGFSSDGFPKLRFEPHHFNRRVSKELAMPFTNNGKGFSSLKSETDKAAYLEAFERLGAAAIESTSWGMFQLMGFHWKSLGFESPFAFLEAMKTEEGQYDTFARFINRNKIQRRAVEQEDPSIETFKSFAKSYNGPSNVENYSGKMWKIYDTLTKAHDTGETA